jgi:hypothetical protein
MSIVFGSVFSISTMSTPKGKNKGNLACFQDIRFKLDLIALKLLLNFLPGFPFVSLCEFHSIMVLGKNDCMLSVG